MSVFQLLWVLPLLLDAQTIELQEVLTLGADGGNEASVFSRVIDAELDERGNVYVLDKMAGEIRVFGLDGEYLRSFGRLGEGPAEFQDPRAMDRVDGTILVSDSRRLTQFTPTGDLLREFPVFEHGLSRALPLGDGALVALREGVATMAHLEGNQVVRILRGGIWSDLMEGPSSGVFFRSPDRTLALKSPLCSTLYLAPFDGGGFLVAHGGGGLLRRFSPEGSVVAEIQVTGEAPPLDDQLERELVGLARKWVPSANRESVILPPYDSQICGLEVESGDRAWVQIRTAEGRTWLAVDLETGEAGASFRLPDDERVVVVRNGRIASIGRDSLDVEYVHVYVLSRPGTS